MLAWVRDKAPHRAQQVSVVYERRGDIHAANQWKGWRVGNLRPIFEPILWFVKPYKIGTTLADNALTYGVGPYNEQALMRYVKRPDNILRYWIYAIRRRFASNTKTSFTYASTN